MENATRYLFALLVVVISGCGINFGKYTLSDVNSTQVAEDKVPANILASEQTGLKAKLVVPQAVIYDEDLSFEWGFDKSECKNFYETNEARFTGNVCLALEWDKKTCPWVGCGREWNHGNPVDLSNVISKGALQFWIRNQSGKKALPNISVSLEDNKQKNSAVKISTLYFEGTEITEAWQKIMIPLEAFNFQLKGVDVSNMKQILFSFEGKGAVYMDKIELVGFSGDLKNPFGKDMHNLEALTKTDKVKLPLILFDEEAVVGWGLDHSKNKDITIQDEIIYHGDRAIKWEWDMDRSPDWVGWGIVLNNSDPIDVTDIEENAALEFYIRLEKGQEEKLPITLTFEDAVPKGVKRTIDARYIQSDKFSTKWEKVVIPLAGFMFASSGLQPQNMKQLMIEGNDKGCVYLDDIRIVAYSGPSGNPFNKARYNLSIKKEDIAKDESTGTEGCFVGAFMPLSPVGVGSAFAYQTGRAPASVMWYSDFTVDLPLSDIQKVIQQGYVPHICWEAMNSIDRTGPTLTDLIAGKWDTYLINNARSLKQLTGTVQLRILHEMNGNWYPWAVPLNNNDPKLYVDAWRHIVDIFRKEQVTNVEWVWCFMNQGVPNEAEWNQPEKVYPGDDYVDWVSVDLYNWGSGVPGFTDSWTSFRDLFLEHYVKMVKNWPSKPIMIPEFASNERGGDKGKWLIDMQTDINTYFPRLKNYNYFDINKESDWRVASSPETQKAFQQIMKDTHNRSSGKALSNVVSTYKKDHKDLSDFKPLEALLKEKEEEAKKKLAVILKDKKSVNVSKANLISIDGTVQPNEWGSPSFAIGASHFFLKYNDGYLFLAGEISDRTPLQNNNDNANIWNGDAIEFGISSNPNANPIRNDYTTTDFHFGIKATQNGYVWSWSANKIIADAVLKIKKTAAGYSFETQIPLKEIGNCVFQPGKSYDFEIALGDGDGIKRNSQLFWNSKTEGFHNHPYMWGSIKIE